MAIAKRVHPGLRKANPMFHGKAHEKPRLGPLNIAQLNKLIEGTDSKKLKAKYRNAILKKETTMCKCKDCKCVPCTCKK